jgi:hypothetical protein
MAGFAGELAVARVANLEGDLLAGVAGGRRLELGPPAVMAPFGALVERRRAVDPDAASQSPYDRPITSSITSSVPAPIRLRRTSLQARSMPYSFM